LISLPRYSPVSPEHALDTGRVPGSKENRGQAAAISSRDKAQGGADQEKWKEAVSVRPMPGG